jgi:hypothetical protein
MTIIYITYTALAERWEVAVRDHGLLGDLEPITNDPGGDRLQVARDANGVIREVVLDARTWEPSELIILEEAFGAVVPSTVEHLIAEGDLEMSVRVPSVTDLDLIGTEETSLAGEPGIPVPVEEAVALSGSKSEEPTLFAVPGIMAEAGSGAVAAQILLHHGELRIQLPGTSQTAGMWVRISVAASGALVHIAPLRATSAGRAVGNGAADTNTSERGDTVEARLTWGLNEDLRQVHIGVTTDPTIPVGDRSTRRRAWAEDLLAVASGGKPVQGRPRRIRVRREAARQAAQVAEALDDSTLQERARIQLHRLNRQRWLRVGLIAAGAVALGGATALVISAARTGPSMDQGNLETEVVEPGPISAGPARFVFPDRSEVRASVTGRVPVLPAGDSLTLDLVHTAVISMGFGPSESDLSVDIATESARANCLSAVNMAADGSIFRSVVRPLLVKFVRDPQPADGEVGEVIPVVASLPSNWAQWSSIPETCTRPEFGPGNQYSGEVIATSEPLRVEVPIPADLPAGVWRIGLLLDGAEADQVIGAVRIRVTD